jgi:type II secretory pathway pseudopilin PulG
MKLGEKGFAYIELLLAIAITGLVSVAASASIFQIFGGTEHNSEHITAVGQVENAGYWISRDAQMAQSVATDSLEPPDFLIITWTEWDVAGEPVYHSARYFFEDLTDGIGSLKRSYWSSAGADEQTLIARCVYYDPSDVDDTSKASYQRPVLTVQLTALFDEILEIREYKIKHRPTL